MLYMMHTRTAATVARDAYGRTAAVGAGIGAADIGGTYTLSATGLISINGSQLVAALTTSANRTAFLPISLVNGTVYLDFSLSSLPASGTHNVVLCGRVTDASNMLRGKLTVDSAGAITLRAFTTSAGTETGVGSSASVTRLGTMAINTNYRLIMQYSGSDVRMKIRKLSQVEPAAWDYSGTQTAIPGAGGVGWRILASSGTACTFTLDNFLAKGSGILRLEPATEAASGTIQSIIDDTTGYPNGSTVLIADGTYYEALSVPAGRNLTLKAANDGGVIISGSSSTTLTAGWASEGSSTYSHAMAYQVYGVMVSGRPLLRFTSVANLKNNKFGNGTTTAPPEGFYADATTLYVKLEGGGDPSGTTITVTRSGVTTSASQAITIDGTSGNEAGLTAEGITFENWPRRAVFVSETSTFIALRCWFHNCYLGVTDSSATGTPTNHIRLESCTFNLCGTAGTYNGPWAIRKALGATAQGTSGGTQYLGNDGIYNSNLGGKLCKVTCDDIQVYRCVVHDSFDGVEIKGRYTDQDYGVANMTSYIRECLFWRTCDNGPEVEPGNRYTYMDVDHNIAVDSYVPFAMAPFLRGRLRVYRNVAYISEDWYTDSGATVGTVFKVAGTSAFPGMPTGYPTDNPLADPLYTQRNIQIYNNTFIMGRSATQQARPVTADEPNFVFEGCYYRDNITVHYKSRKWELGGFVLSPYNILYPGASAAQFTQAHYLHASIGGTATIWDGTVWDTRPTTAPTFTAPLLGSTSTTLFNPTGAMAASDGGTLGAVAYGSSWSMPTVGCQWTAATATRPSIPASIAASQMGLA